MAGAVSPPTANRTGTPGTSRPPASAATAVKRSTSPVRAMSVPTARTSEVTGFSTTSIVMASRSAATAAVTVTVPVSSKARKPNRSRVATAGSLVPKRDRHVFPAGADRVRHRDVEARAGPRVEDVRHFGEGDLRNGRQRHRHRDLDPRAGVGTAAPVPGIRRHEGDERELAGTIRLDASGTGHADAAARARVVDDPRVVHDGASSVPHRGGQLRRLAYRQRQRLRGDLDSEADRRLVLLPARHQRRASQQQSRARGGDRHAHSPSTGPPIGLPTRCPGRVSSLAAHLAPLPCAGAGSP